MIGTMRVVAAVVALAVALAAAPAAADECGDAVNDYNAVLSHLNDAMQRYSTCIADSKGMDDCAAAFRALRTAQGEFASAVDIYIKQCR